MVSNPNAAANNAKMDSISLVGSVIALAFDGDEAGLAGMRTAAAKLITQPSCFVNVVKLPDGREPDQLDRDELDTFFGFATP